MIGQYDVVFVRRKGDAIEHTEFLARNVNKAEASRVVSHYCYRSGTDEGVQVVQHGTLKQAVESALWQ